MTFWLCAYFWFSIACTKPIFKILIFKGGGGSAYGPVLKINPFSVVHANITHLRTYIHKNLAFSMQKNVFHIFSYGPVFKITLVYDDVAEVDDVIADITEVNDVITEFFI